MFLTLQHRPKTIRFDTNGLHFNFTGAAGYAALMPLYGAYKPLPAGQESSPFAALKDKKKRVLTWEWHKALPADPLARARYWASAAAGISRSPSTKASASIARTTASPSRSRTAGSRGATTGTPRR